jgi:hypothetical protein
VKPLSVVSEGTVKINDECGKMIIVGKLFIWSMYRDESK